MLLVLSHALLRSPTCRRDASLSLRSKDFGRARHRRRTWPPAFGRGRVGTFSVSSSTVVFGCRATARTGGGESGVDLGSTLLRCPRRRRRATSLESALPFCIASAYPRATNTTRSTSIWRRTATVRTSRNDVSKSRAARSNALRRRHFLLRRKLFCDVFLPRWWLSFPRATCQTIFRSHCSQTKE